MLTVRGLNPGTGKCLFFAPKLPDRVWGSPSLLFNGYRRSFPGVNSRGANLTTYLHLVTKLRMNGAVPLISLHVFVERTGKDLPFTIQDIVTNRFFILVTPSIKWIKIFGVCLTVHLPHEITWIANLMQQGNFIDVFLAGVSRHNLHRTHDLCSGSQDHHPSKKKLGAENHMLQLNIQCSWWWPFVPETCRAKNTLIKLLCCLKLAFQVISRIEISSFVQWFYQELDIPGIAIRFLSEARDGFSRSYRLAA